MPVPVWTARRRGRPAARCARFAAALLLGGCSAQPVGPPALSLRPLGYDSLPGWGNDPVASLLPALLRQCRRLAQLPPDSVLGGGVEAVPGAPSAGTAAADGLPGRRAGEWAPFCAAATAIPGGDDAAARRAIAAWLQPYAVGDRGDERARYTGYYEPEFAGSLSRDASHAVAVYGRPPDLLTLHPAGLAGEPVSGRVSGGRLVPYWTRAEIDRGALAGRGLELVWLSAPADLFFLQLQGSGRVRLPTGQIVRLGYAGRNGAAYVPLGRLLVEQGQLAPDGVDMQSIRAWLEAHPGQAGVMMEQNPNYVFFRSLDALRPDQGPPGALGVDLQPMRSLAVDRRYLPLSAPVWVDTTRPDGQALQRLMLAQDLGTDIEGPARADIFFGWGADAARMAGTIHAGGRLVVLLPRPPARAAAPVAPAS